MSFKIIDFETIQTIWYEEDMWGQLAYAPPVNEYLYLNGKNKKIKDLNYSKPVFYGYLENNKILGVNSYFHVNEDQCRSRGLYVYPKYRKNGIAIELLKYAIDQNKNKGYKFIWSKPRDTAIKSYQAAGYKITSDAFNITPDGEKMLFKNHYCRYDYEI